MHSVAMAVVKALKFYTKKNYALLSGKIKYAEIVGQRVAEAFLEVQSCYGSNEDIHIH
jgi:hypothetical protein